MEVHESDLLQELSSDVVEEAKKPLSLEDLKEILGSTIKRDDINKLITFLAMLNAYTEESQFNVSFRAPSSTGKSYIPIELAQYFPEEDVMMIAYSSPTSFYHDTGIWDEERNAVVINLERKIVIFLDQPHDMLLQRLRPLLSHDQKELLYKITDKREKKGLRTKNVIIKGFCSVIFCTGSLRIDEQEATRNFILSPETSAEKIREGIYLKALRKGNPKLFEEYLREFPERRLLKIRIRKIRDENIKKVIIKNIDEVVDEFLKRYPRAKPRHQRDIERIISLIQGLALLNLWHRERDEDNNLYANDEDVKNGFELFEAVAKSQELGLPPYIYNFFKEVIEPLWDEVNEGVDPSNPIGLSRKQILKKHYEVYGRVISEKYLKNEVIPTLENAGLIYLDKDPLDKRRSLIYIVKGDTPPLKGIVTLRSDTPDIIDKILELREKGYGVRRIAKELGLSHMKVWRLLKENERNKAYRNSGNQVGVGTPSTESTEFDVRNVQENEIMRHYEETEYPSLLRCNICGAYFGRNKVDLLGHLRWHEEGDKNE